MDSLQMEMTFDGATYEPKHDKVRLTGQSLRVWECMKDGNWRTLGEIGIATGDRSESALSARLRDFRKDRFGSHTVNRRARGERADGLFEYQLVVNQDRGQ